MSKLYRRPDIDGLRAVAVIAVLVYHAFPSALPGGFVGVDIFFVISGYLITGIVYDDLAVGRFSLRRFYAGRIRRIVPALIVVLIGTFALGWRFLMPDELAQLGQHLAASASFTSNYALLSEAGYFDTNSLTKPLLHLWSLAIETQYYLAWPLALLVFARFIKSPIWPTIFLLAISLAWCIWLTGIRPDEAFYSPATRAWELLIGAALVLFQRNASANPWLQRPQLSLLGGALILGSIVYLSEGPDFPGWRAIAPALGTVLFIASGPQAIANRALSARPIVFVGLISYSLYLWHWPVLVFGRLHSDGPLSNVETLALLVLAGALSCATYYLVEKPTRRPSSTKWIPVSACAALLSIGAVGLSVSYENGFPSRFPAEAQAVAAFSYDYRTSFREGECFLTEGQPYDEFQPCGLDGSARKPSLLLWGDSYAAHLFKGYEHVLGSQFQIVQRTASACPPIPGIAVAGRPYCQDINEQVMALVADGRFSVVVLAAAWFTYDWEKIGTTIAMLQKLGVPSVQVVGPLPYWTDGLPRQLLTEFMRTGDFPQWMRRGLSEDIVSLDAPMRKFVDSRQATFLSPVSAMCNQRGCLTIADEHDPTSLMTWDTGHLTEAGAEKLVLLLYPQQTVTR